MAPSGSGSKKARASQRNASDRVAQMRKEQQAKDRRRLLAIWGAAAVTIALVVGAVTFAVINDKANTPSLEAVKDYSYEAGAHVQTPVTYKETPPVGGEHNPVWLNCGVYDSPVPNENAVHSLEHGAVWVTYDAAALSDDDLATLKSFLPSSYVILSPYEGLPTPIVLSAWNAQLQIEDADDERIAQFFEEYWRNQNVPEPGALCSAGIDGPGKQS